MRSFILIVTCCSMINAQSVSEGRDAVSQIKKKRSIPYPGQALQATSQVLNHPIVAAALQKISMNALATVASALNQVHQEELARKTEVDKTLDTMASLKSVAKSMPMLLDGTGAGSGESEEMSGSGAESGAGEVIQEHTDAPADTAEDDSSRNTTSIADNAKKSKTEKEQHRHQHRHNHHRHRHHRHHHNRHNKHKVESFSTNHNRSKTIDWSRLQNNSKAFDKIAEEANIPVSKLLAIFRSGASRSEIAKKTEELLNRTIESQAELAHLFETEEKVSTKNEDDSESGESDVKSSEKKAHSTAKNKTAEYEIPKNIPENCAKIIKQYTDGELTLKDYLKELKICKKNEEISKQLANTTPMQREAVATQNVIQQEAYNYALNTMTRNFKPTAKEQANAVLDQWRTNSFGDKSNTEGKPIPDNVKSFMTIQTPKSVAAKDTEPSSSSTSATEQTKTESSEATKSTVSLHTPDSTTVPFPNTKSADITESMTTEPFQAQKEQETVSFTANANQLFKKSSIPGIPASTSNTFMNKLNILSGINVVPSQNIAALQQVATNTQVFPQVNAAPPAAFMNPQSNPPQFGFNQIVQQNVRSNIPGLESNEKLPFPSNTNVYAQQSVDQSSQNIAPEVETKSTIGSPETDSITDTTNQHIDNNVTPLLPKVSNIENGFGNTEPLLTGQELAAEAFIASLANPVLQEIPVDTSLVAALRSLGGFDSAVVDNPKDNLLLASLQKRHINKRFAKRDISDSHTSRRHKKHMNFALKHGKRDTSDKIKNAKPIERSNMGLPLINYQPGPKLMDKIRDMSRVIAKP